MMKYREHVEMLAKGYRYIISFADKNKPPIFAKTTAGVAKMMREDFPNEKGWQAVEIQEDQDEQRHRAFMQRLL